MKIPLFKPYLGKEELDALRRIFKTGWVGLGPQTEQFEKEFAKYIGVKEAVGVNSCTAALHLAVLAYDFPKGSEILVPTITFISTAFAADYNGCKPVFVDADPETLCIDVKDAERKITKKTKAIIPVHLGGQACDMDKIMALAKKYGLIVIEDVANACGGEYKGRKLGSIGHMGCFSFEAKKNMTTGDGGMVVSNDLARLSRLRKVRWCGIDKDTWKRFSQKSAYSWYYEISELGFKYNMNDIQAALGRVQLKKLDKVNARKRKTMKKYIELLAGSKVVKTSKYLDLKKGGYWLFIVRSSYRDKLIDFLGKIGITCGVHFMPVHLHPYYKKYKANCPAAEKVWKEIVTLPLFYAITANQLKYVAKMIKELEQVCMNK